MPTRIPGALVAALALASSVSAQTLLDDDFSDLDRTNQSLTSSSQWVTISPSSTLVATSGALVQTVGSGNRAFYTYFTDSAPASLAIGSTLTASFDFTFSGANAVSSTANALRLGLLNSFGTDTDDNGTTTATRATTDGAGISAGNMPYASGYFFSLSAAPTAAGGITAWERTDNATQGVLNTSYAASLTTGGSDLNFVTGNLYAASLSVTRTAADGVLVTLAFTGDFVDAGSATVATTQTLSATDTSGATYTFDTLAFFAGTNLASSITLDNVSVSVSAVPEPATCAVLAGALALGFAALRRRRSA